MNLQHLLDVLPIDMQVTRVLQLEALGQPKKEQQGLIYVVARHTQAEVLQTQFQALQKTLASSLVFAHISAARPTSHAQSNDWQNLWADVVQAKQKGNQT